LKYECSTPHLIEGTDVLKNKADLTDRTALVEFETGIFSLRMMDVPEGDFSTDHLKKIHKHLTQDVYEWAGEFRDVPTARGSSRFCQPQFIGQETDKATKSVDIEKMKTMKPKEFSNELAEIVGDLNAVHPFLDGNGRAIRVYAQQVAQAAGYDLEIHRLRGDSWNKASEESFNGNNRRLESILSRNLARVRERGLER